MINKILDGVFKGFVNLAITICSEKHLDNELDFLTEVFVENGYEKQQITRSLTVPSIPDATETNM